MWDILAMNKKERWRKTLLEQILTNQLSRNDVAQRLSLSKRQLRRIMRRYEQHGDAGLIHQSRGKTSGHSYPSEFREHVISLYQQKYLDFGPTFAVEKLLEEDGLKVNAETLRLWLKWKGLWHNCRKRKSHRSWRQRRSRFGELLQLDGSIHCWFSGNQQKQCLMNMVDDATGVTLAYLDTGETTHAAFTLLREWIKKYGIPLSIYVDLKSLYVSPKALRYSSDDEFVEPEWLTHFSLACKKLGISVIKAYSPQAKGRVERKHAVYQDRFVKELKFRAVTTIEKANKILAGGFIDKLNEKFAKPPLDQQDAHIPCRNLRVLEDVFCWEYIRQVKNDWTIQFNKQYYQIDKSNHCLILPKHKVTVRKGMRGEISLWKKGNRLHFRAINERPETISAKVDKVPYNSIARSKNGRLNGQKSPWHNYTERLKLQKAETVETSQLPA